MTLTCPACDSVDVDLVDDNGAEFPETRVEFYECQGCGWEFKEVLTA
jgi:DNA-directed RNA polymerase subunit M/transcription elongation factor TFIIS